MAFRDNNVAMGLPQNNPFQVGVSDDDSDRTVEQGVNIEWASEAEGSYMFYDCTVGCMLDSGIVVHNRLPQANNAPDTLASVYLDGADLASITDKGVNLRCNDQYQDIVQRMGHAQYWFRIWGQALRVGYQIPIPAIKFIGGVAAIPYDKNPQWAFNRIFPGGNYGGVILWHAQWSLWYTTAQPPTSQYFPAASPTVHVAGSLTPDKDGIQAPFSQADDNAAKVTPIPGTFTKR